MGRKPNTQPSYLLHKPSGQARVRIGGVDHYLGPHGSKESWNRYYELLSDRVNGSHPQPPRRPSGARLTIAELIEQYRAFAIGYYGGPKAKELYRIASACRPLDAIYATTPADEFSPLKLQKVLDRLVFEGDTRKEIVRAGGRTISRTTVNDYLLVLKRMFKWAVSQELIPSAVYQALLTVDGVRAGRGQLAAKTHEPRKVLPVDVAAVEQTLAHCQPEIAAMVRVQLLCGMRPDEVTILRPCDIDRAGEVWVYRPTTHKNSWRGQTREILIGPAAQKLLAPWIAAVAPDEYLFSPTRVAERWNAEQIANGKAKKTKAFKKLVEAKPLRAAYDDRSYRQAVRRACKRAEVDVWTPNQLRHTAGTQIRAQHGAEAAKLVLGHRHLNTTEIYAEKDLAKYAEIMRQLG